MKVSKWTADFETTTDENDCRVWAYSICNVNNPEEFIYGNTLDSFFEWCFERGTNLKIWFHNLKFDGVYLLSWLDAHSFERIEKPEDKADGTYTTLITDMGQFYSIKMYFQDGNKIRYVEFLDSLKIFPNMSVDKIAKGFDLPIQKLSIDYNKFRPIGYELEQAEIDYIRNDVEIVARALQIMFDEGLTKMTIAGDAMQDFKKRMVGFRKKFPLLTPEVDADIRSSYRGGFTYCNEEWQGKNVDGGIILDVNSLYPSTMVQFPLPYGQPYFFEGKYEDDNVYPLYVQSLSCVFELKEGKIPCIQMKNHMSFIPNEYVKSSQGMKVQLWLTKPDYELFLEHYNVYNPVYHGGWKFKESQGYFDDYINYWTERKIQASKEGNASIRQISKLMLNSLYGRFGLSPKASQKKPVFDRDGVMHFVNLPTEERESMYIPIASFITAYGRNRTIRTSQIIKDYTKQKYGRDLYFYSDTDSIHCYLSDDDLEELKDIIKIDDYALGCWAKEGEFTRGMYLRQKCYIEEIDGKCHVTVAGLPKYLAPLISFENFKRGFSTVGMTRDEMIKLAMKNGATNEEIEKLHPKLIYKYVKGGVILKETDFTIK